MNGEMAQMSKIVMSARKALFNNDEIDFVLDKYVLSVKFLFTSRGKIIRKCEECNSVRGWFNICKKRNIDDIKFIVPTAVEDRYELGFANSSQGSIVCFWKKGEVTYFSPVWEFDRENHGWNIVYEEHIWKEAPEGKPSFVNRSEEFKTVLLDIEKLAANIEFKNFADIFHRAYEALCEYSFIEDNNMPVHLPNEFRGIYYAVMTADVFGAMGSWNDSPPYYAEEKGLGKEYNELSNKLLAQLRYNLMYVVNECWK